MLTGTTHDNDDWRQLAEAAAAALPRVPALRPFEEVAAGSRDPLFAELGYTFWNRDLVDALAARLLPERELRWVELAAGTGRWALEMARRGIPVAATDSYAQSAERVRSFQRPVRYGEWVGEMDAAEAVSRFRPEGILCAWPPLGHDLVGRLLRGELPGSEALRLLVCIGEPAGATELPGEDVPGWRLERWPECEPYLIGFNDPPRAAGWRSHSRLRVYRRSAGRRGT